MFLILGALRGFNTCKLIRETIASGTDGCDYSIVCCSRREFQGQSCSTTWTRSARKGPWYLGNASTLIEDCSSLTNMYDRGGIGRNLMKKAAAFGMTTQYYNRSKLSEELSGGAKYVSFDELLSTSDVLSLNLPLNVSQLKHDVLSSMFGQHLTITRNKRVTSLESQSLKR